MSGSRVSRRSMLRAGALGAGVLGAGGMAGCDLDPRTSSSKPTVSTPPSADQRIVEAARAELGLLIARLSATPGAGDLVACHRRQLQALRGRPPARHGRRLTSRQVVAREKRAAERFKRWALRSQDGDLARVLASVAAGIRTQRLPRAST